MFTWLNKQGVKSDQGFVVQSIDRFVIQYSEAMGTIDLSSNSRTPCLRDILSLTRSNDVKKRVYKRVQN